MCSFRAHVFTLATLSMFFCSCVADNYVASIEVKRGSSIAQKRAIASEMCTLQELLKLKEQLKRTMGDVTDSQLKTLQLRWAENVSEHPSVKIVVGIDTRGVTDATRIVDTAALLIDRQINQPELQHE